MRLDVASFGWLMMGETGRGFLGGLMMGETGRGFLGGGL